MSLLSRLMGLLIALVIVPLFGFAACSVAFEQTFIDAETYRDAFDNQNIFEDLLPLTMPALLRVAQEDPESRREIQELPIEIERLLNTLSPDDWRDITRDLVPPEWLQAQFNASIDVMTALFAGDLDVLDRTIDLGEIRDRLSGPEAVQAVERLLAKAPICTRAQIDQIRTLAAGGDVRLPVCRPGDNIADREQLEDFSITTLTAFMRELGAALGADRLTFGELMDLDRNTAESIGLLVELDGQILTLLYLCPAGLLGLVIAFAVRSIKGLGWWMGGILMVSGALMIALILLLQAVAINSTVALLEAETESQMFFMQMFVSLVRSAISQSSGILLAQAGGFFLVGFIMIMIGAFTPGRSESVVPVYITEDGEVISTASARRSGSTIRLNQQP